MYSAVSAAVNGRNAHRSAMRCLSWRYSGASSLRSNSCWPARMICSSLPRRFSRFPSSRISSSTSHSRLCASSTISTVIAPVPARSSSIWLSANSTSVFEERLQVQAEIVRQHLEELLRRQARIEQRGEDDLLGGQKIAQALEHHGLARAHFPGQDHEAFAALHAVDEVRQRLLVLRAAEQKRRVRAQAERVFGKAEKGLVHGGLGVRRRRAQPRPRPAWRSLPASRSSPG